MKRWLALLLALCMTGSLSISLLAEATGQTQDTGEAIYEIYTGTLEEPNQKGRIANMYWRDTLPNSVKPVYDHLLLYFEGIYNAVGTASAIPSKTSMTSSVTVDQGMAALTALLKDRPEYLYWVAKGSGQMIHVLGNGSYLFFYFPVVAEYKQGVVQTDTYHTSGGGTTTMQYWEINTLKGLPTGTVKDAMAIAAQIVAAAPAGSYEKVKYFNQRICGLTTYDNAAALPGAAFGDASQMSNVFLGKPVICEGYAKAFKYLCDQANIDCLLMTGLLNTSGSDWGNHMWNVVKLDGAWYLVDVTNNDAVYPNRFLLIGSNNPNYVSFDPTKLDDGSDPGNPNITLSVNDYTPGAVVPGEKALVVQFKLAANQINLQVNTAGSTAAYTGAYRLALSDVQLRSVATGAVIPPDRAAASNGAGGAYEFYLNTPLSFGTYTLELVPKSGFSVREITGNPAELSARLPKPTIAFSAPDLNSVVTMTVTAPDHAAGAQMRVVCTINGQEQTRAILPATFKLARSITPNYSVTAKVIDVNAGYQDSAIATATLTIPVPSNNLQLEIRPVTGLYYPVAVNTAVASLHVKNARGNIRYELINDVHHNFLLKGDMLYTAQSVNQSSVSVTVRISDSGVTPPHTFTQTATLYFNKTSSGGGGGSSGGGGGNGTVSVVSRPRTWWTLGNNATSATELKKLTSQAVTSSVKAAKQSGLKSTTAGIRVTNLKSISRTMLQTLLNEAKNAAANTGVTVRPMLVSETIVGGKLESRVYIDPAQATLNTDLALGISVNKGLVAQLFTAYYKNVQAVVSTTQRGSFGMPVTLEVQLASGVDAKTVVVYSYNAADNSFTALPASSFKVDPTSKMLQITAIGGGDFIASSGKLQKK